MGDLLPPRSVQPISHAPARPPRRLRHPRTGANRTPGRVLPCAALPFATVALAACPPTSPLDPRTASAHGGAVDQQHHDRPEDGADPPAGATVTSPRNSRLIRKPPTNEPTIPSTIVVGTLMGSGPGTSSRARNPAIAPMTISPMMNPTMMVSLPLGDTGQRAAVHRLAASSTPCSLATLC